MSERLTVATWNVERVSMRSWKRLPAIQAAMSAVDADVWVLTETREGLCPAEGYHALHTPGRDRWYIGVDERMASIWSRWPVTPTAIPPRARGFVSGLVDAPFGQFVVVAASSPTPATGVPTAPRGTGLSTGSRSTGSPRNCRSSPGWHPS